MERLDKFLCDSGIGTRSQVKVILKSGRVTVDGKVEKDNGKKIDPAKQVITLDGEVLGGKRRESMDCMWSIGGLSPEESAQEVLEAKALGYKDITWMRTGCVITCHGGPGAFGIVASTK